MHLPVVFLHVALTFGLSPKTNAESLFVCETSCSCRKNNTRMNCFASRLNSVPELPSWIENLNLGQNYLGPNLDSTFETFTELETLHLSNNNLVQLNGDMINGLVNLRSLHLDGNMLRTLPDDLFKDTIDLQYLDLSRNQFYTLPDKSFRYLGSIKHLNISFNHLVSPVLTLRFQVMTRLSILDMSGNNFQIINANSFEMTKNWEVTISKTFNLSNCNIQWIEPGAFRHPKSLRTLIISGNSEISEKNITNALHDFEQSGVKTLDLSDMNIFNISDMFQGVGHLALTELDLSGNKITSIPEGTFTYIPTLQRLFLHHNTLSSLSGLAVLGNLEYLDLARNNITTIEPPLLENFANMKSLLLSNNAIQMFPNSLFQYLKKLTVLDLGENNLTTFEVSETSRSIQFVSIRNNGLLTLGHLTGLKGLQRLDVSQNKLGRLDAYLFSFNKDIKYANFSHNAIAGVDSRTFLPNVPHIIDLSFNNITSLKNCGWLGARELYLVGSNIANIDKHSFYAMNLLTTLHLSKNQISELKPETFRFLSNLSVLNINDNVMTNFSVLSKAIAPLELLTHLDLSGNKFHTIDKMALVKCKRLKSISIARNRIGTVDPAMFKPLHHLAEIDMSMNPYHCSCGLLDFQKWIRRTHVRILSENNVGYQCKYPSKRDGEYILDFEVSHFECNQYMLYVIAFSSLGGLAMIVAGALGLSCYIYRKGGYTIQRVKSKEHTDTIRLPSLNSATIEESDSGIVNDAYMNSLPKPIKNRNAKANLKKTAVKFGRPDIRHNIDGRYDKRYSNVNLFSNDNSYERKRRDDPSRKEPNQSLKSARKMAKQGKIPMNTYRTGQRHGYATNSYDRRREIIRYQREPIRNETRPYLELPMPSGSRESPKFQDYNGVLQGNFHKTRASYESPSTSEKQLRHSEVNFVYV